MANPRHPALRACLVAHACGVANPPVAFDTFSHPPPGSSARRSRALQEADPFVGHVAACRTPVDVDVPVVTSSFEYVAPGPTQRRSQFRHRSFGGHGTPQDCIGPQDSRRFGAWGELTNPSTERPAQWLRGSCTRPPDPTRPPIADPRMPPAFLLRPRR